MGVPPEHVHTEVSGHQAVGEAVGEGVAEEDSRAAGDA